MLGLVGRMKTTRLACAAYLSIAAVVAQDVLTMSDLEIMGGIDQSDSFFSDLHPCPTTCKDTPSSNWTVYTSMDRLALCDEPMLFDFSISNPVADPNTITKLRVCTTSSGNAKTTTNAEFNGTSAEEPVEFTKRADDCEPSIVQSNATIQLAWGGEGDQGDNKALLTGLDSLKKFFEKDFECSSSPFMFSYTKGIIAGIYSGPYFGRATVSNAIKEVSSNLGSAAGASNLVAQICNKGRTSDHIFGVAISTSQNITNVQNAVKSWAEAKCVGDLDYSSEIKDVKTFESPLGLVVNGTLTNGTSTGNTTQQARDLHARADCRIIRVVSGDSCGSLASKCGISSADFTKYNTKTNLCSTLAVGQPVCCSSGTLPDIKPKPNSDGTCATYKVNSGDTCSALAASNGLTQDEIEEFNEGQTWGWMGCKQLMADVNICLSKGNPPLPYPIANAVCGPTKPGTVLVPDQVLDSYNPCPLNACCNKWGQCGITPEFCTYEPGTSPGTSKLQNGCVWSCGTKITNTAVPPSEWARIGYYETWNFNRECLRQAVRHANTDGSYTHIHWAFAEVNPSDWSIKINDTYKQWSDFKAIREKKVISFGGWGYSTEPGTYDILRQAMNPSNRNTFAINIAKFLEDNKLDGVDFDWEYPGAIDIPGTPPGQPSDGPNYLKFLTVMKQKLPSGKSMSIAAPASYWYLKAFPIKEMAKLLDYIVYMTYDLHGQWDAGNQHAIEGCPAGNCLRSHVNLTETNYALAMLTKAGVGTSKIFVGESSYGRSFKMAQAGCKGPMCTFTGDRSNSNAAKGMCTDTAGYISNAEIDDIIATGTKVDKWHDFDSNSDMLVYEDTEWVAYMTPTTKKTRRDLWKGQNFHGTIDWATDLQAFTDDEFLDDEGNNDWDKYEEWPPALSKCEGSYDSIDAIETASKSIPFHCKDRYIVEVLKKMHSTAISDYDKLMNGGYDKKFKTYADAVVKSGKSVVDKFMHDHGNDYFWCDVTEDVSCCDWCHHYYSGVEDGQCRYCGGSCGGWSTICDNPDVQCGEVPTTYKNITDKCPPDYSLRAGPEPADGYANSVYWHMRNDKNDKFWADLYTNTGIGQDSIKLGNVHRISSCAPTDKHCADRQWDYNYPIVSGYDREDVIDPKDVVEKAYGNLKNLGSDLDRAINQIKIGVYGVDTGDLVDSLALPVLMVKDAVKQMSDIIDTVNDMEEEKRKNIILAFLSALFFFLPIAGQVLGAVTALANVGRILATIGTLGDVALEIQSIVEDKDNLPLAIFGIVLAPLAVMDAAKIGKAADSRRQMSAEQVSKLGERVSKPLESISRIKGGTCARRAASKRDMPFGAIPEELSWGMSPVAMRGY